MNGIAEIRRSGDFVKSVSGLDAELIDELIAHFERLETKPIGLSKALRIMEDAVRASELLKKSIHAYRSRLHQAFLNVERILRVGKYSSGKFGAFVAKILNKVIIKIGSSSTRKRTSAGAFVCLLNKLKPTSDGKDDAAIIDKAHVMNCFFNNLGVITYGRFKNQALA